MTDLTLPDARIERDQLAERTDVLDRVGVLRTLPDRNNGQARKTMYIKAIHAVDLARLVGLLPNLEVAS